MNFRRFFQNFVFGALLSSGIIFCYYFYATSDLVLTFKESYGMPKRTLIGTFFQFSILGVGLVQLALAYIAFKDRIKFHEESIFDVLGECFLVFFYLALVYFACYNFTKS